MVRWVLRQTGNLLTKHSDAAGCTHAAASAKAPAACTDMEVTYT